MKADDCKFILALAAAIILGFLVVFTAPEELDVASGGKVDIEMIESLEREGRLSLIKADHWEPVKEDRR